MLPPSSEYKIGEDYGFWDLTSYCSVAKYPRFRETWCHHLQSLRYKLNRWLLYTELYGVTSSNTVVDCV